MELFENLFCRFTVSGGLVCSLYIIMNNVILIDSMISTYFIFMEEPQLLPWYSLWTSRNNKIYSYQFWIFFDFPHYSLFLLLGHSLVELPSLQLSNEVSKVFIELFRSRYATSWFQIYSIHGSCLFDYLLSDELQTSSYLI